MTILRWDIESFGEKEADLPTKGLDIYSAHPATRVLMAQYQIDDGPITSWEAHRGPVPAELREALLDPKVEKWAFNAQFERVMTRRVLKIKTPYEGWRCTMSLAYLQCFKGTLEEVGEQMGLGAEVKKDPEGKRLIRLFSMPQNVTKNQPHRIRDWRTDPEDWQKFLDYCRQDVVAETAIWNRLIRFPVPDSEWELYELDQRINDRGKPVDMAFVNHAIAMADRRQKELVDRLREVTGLSNPNSVSQFLPWLKERGYPFDDLNKDTVQKVLKEKTAPECEEALRLRQWAARLSIKKYNTLRDTTGRGDRARFLFQFAGASRTARWAGRRVQTQNLPRTPKSIDPDDDGGEKLAATSAMIRDGDYDALDLMFTEPMEALVGCVRSAFGVKPGKKMLSADLASIEACVVAWLFDVPKMLEVIRGGRDIYKDFGTYLFRKPYEQITKAERNICKPPTLGAPYRLGGGDLKNGRRTGLWGYAENMGVDMTREQSHAAVKVFREVYAPEVVEAWYDLERAVKRAMTSNGPVKVGKLTFERIKPYMTLVLPSGRRVFYFQPRIETKVYTREVERRGEIVEETYTREVFTYMGQNQDTGRWERLENHGGRFVEQCFGAETLVLTCRGPQRIVDVTTDDWVWDGVEWVSHSGLLPRGERETIDFGGVRVTSDHRIDVEGQWTEAGETSADEAASSFSRHHRLPLSLPDGRSLRRVGRGEVAVACTMRLRRSTNDAGDRSLEGQAEVLWVQGGRADLGREPDARHEQHPALEHLAEYIGQVREPEPRALRSVRRPGHQGLRPLAEILHDVLARYAGRLPGRPDDRADQQRRELRARELSMGDVHGAGPQQGGQQGDRHAAGPDAGVRCLVGVGDRCHDATLSGESRMASVDALRSAVPVEQVFDLVNCGPRRRFTVLLPDGRPILVHNCVQATARDILVAQMRKAHDDGFYLVAHIHDEAVAEQDVGDNYHTLDRFIEHMRSPIPWAPGLPLGAAGWEGAFYRK